MPSSHPRPLNRSSSSKALVWSAAPTPFNEDLSLNHQSVARMIDHHADLGVDGVFLAGTCGEGPWMTGEMIVELTKCAADANQSRLQLAVQVTDNSAARTLKNIDALGGAGCDFVVVAQPAMFMNATAPRVAKYYQEILERSPLPVIFYNRGSRPDFPLEEPLLSEIYAHPSISAVKDSSASEAMRGIALAARNRRDGLALLTGDEFACLAYLKAGYDGFMTGGAVLTGAYLRALDDAFKAGDIDEAAKIDERARKALYACYGGRQYACWLTGLKTTLTRLGIFASSASILEYPMTEECSLAIDRTILEEKSWLLTKRYSGSPTIRG